MKFTKIIPALFACAAMLVGSSCNEKTEYVPAESAPLEPYYFTTLTDTYQDLVDGQEAFKVYMGRADRIKAREVSFEVTTDAPEGSFSYPTSVNFAEGQDTISFFVKFDLSKLEFKKEYKLNFRIPGIENTPYCYGNMDITAIYVPWRKFEEKGIYRDGTVSVLFGISEEGIQYDVEIEEHPTIDGFYRIVNPYGPETPFSQYFNVDDKTRYMFVHAENPDRVYIEKFATGIVNGSMGELVMNSWSNELLEDGTSESAIASNGLYASLINGVVKYREKGEYEKQTIVAKFTNNETKYLGNSAGAFKIVLPGYEDEPEWEELGMFNYTDAFLTPLLGRPEPNTYPVLVQQNIPNPKLYRVVNPYGASSGFFDKDPEMPKYMTFDVSTPGCVLMDLYYTNLSLDGNKGEAVFTTMADLTLMTDENATIEDVEAEGLGGVFKDNKIIIPAGNCVYLSESLTTGQIIDLQYCGGTVDGCLDMTKQVGEPEAEATRAKIRALEAKRALAFVKRNGNIIPLGEFKAVKNFKK